MNSRVNQRSTRVHLERAAGASVQRCCNAKLCKKGAGRQLLRAPLCISLPDCPSRQRPTALSTAVSRSWCRTGFVRNSTAPAFIARTDIWMSA